MMREILTDFAGGKESEKRMTRVRPSKSSKPRKDNAEAQEDASISQSNRNR